MYDTISHTAQQLQWQNFSQIFTHERHPIPRPYGRAIGCLSWVIRRKMTAIYRECTVLKWMSWKNETRFHVNWIDYGEFHPILQQVSAVHNRLHEKSWSCLDFKLPFTANIVNPNMRKRRSCGPVFSMANPQLMRRYLYVEAAPVINVLA